MISSDYHICQSIDYLDPDDMAFIAGQWVHRIYWLKPPQFVEIDDFIPICNLITFIQVIFIILLLTLVK